MTVPVPPPIVRKPGTGSPKGRAANIAHVPLLDQVHINQICVAIGSARFDVLLDLLAAELIERPATIRRAILAGDFTLARHESHGFKGATTSVGAMAVGNAAAAIEHAPDLQAMVAAIGILDQQVMRTRRVIANMQPGNLPAHRPL